MTKALPKKQEEVAAATEGTVTQFPSEADVQERLAEELARRTKERELKTRQFGRPPKEIFVCVAGKWHIPFQSLRSGLCTVRLYGDVSLQYLSKIEASAVSYEFPSPVCLLCRKLAHAPLRGLGDNLIQSLGKGLSRPEIKKIHANRSALIREVTVARTSRMRDDSSTD